MKIIYSLPEYLRLVVSFNSETLTREQIRHVVAVCRQHGIAQLLPTLVTTSFDALMHGFRTIREACDEDPTLAQAIVARFRIGDALNRTVLPALTLMDAPVFGFKALRALVR